jgi:hypothetical protein
MWWMRLETCIQHYRSQKQGGIPRSFIARS